MNVNVESLPNCITTLHVEVPPEKVVQARAAITNDFAKQVKLPGFRPGKAPRNVVESRFKKEIQDELRRKILDESTREAIQQKDLKILSIQTVDDFEFAPDDTVRITATLITEPAFELPEYKGIKVTIPPAEITDAEVEAAMAELRDRYSEFTDISGRGVQMDDFVVLDYVGKIDGQKIKEAYPETAEKFTEDTNRWVRMTSEAFLPGFSDGLLGAVPGEVRNVTVAIPEDFPLEMLRGKQVVYEVTVKELKERQLPELNDELAEKIAPGKTLAEIRDLIRDELTRTREGEIFSAKRDQVLNHLVNQVECELPQAFVANEAQRILEEVVRENQVRGVSEDSLKENEQQLFGMASQSARNRLKGQFILSRVAQAEGLKASNEEIRQHVARLAMRHQMTIEKVIKEIEKGAGISAVVTEIVQGKALDFLISNASVETVAEAAS